MHAYLCLRYRQPIPHIHWDDISTVPASMTALDQSLSKAQCGVKSLVVSSVQILFIGYSRSSTVSSLPGKSEVTKLA